MSDPTAAKPVHILLVEDNPGDVRLTQEAFRSIDRDVEFHVVTDGEAAKGLLFVHEDDFSVSTFRQNILAIEDVALNTFMDIIDEFDLDLNPSDDAAADDTTDHDITRSFQ